ncbi:ribulose-phosphate 3-epimerase [Kitasatospora aureofaciens]|uniref:ribulose-phosphate 3-epimerase n=1 Tax=Kitasatospora aureofaciens TaxID=1894 RepID=UPI000526C358|nr:ribulose-phosphate 3-epimerase [Kitasatospora aureofaciens]
MSFLTDRPRERTIIDASLWSADLGALTAEVERIGPYADSFHIDASDTRFTPDAIFFPDLVRALRPRTEVPFHVHLMAHRPAELAAAFADAGANLITVHAEADEALEAITRIRAGGQAAGLALTLDLAPEHVEDLLESVDAVTMVGTPLGTKGTGMVPEALDRMRVIRQILDRRGTDIPLLADGGIREHTVPDLVAAGATGVVAGSLLFGSDDPAVTAEWIRSQPTAARSHGGAR